MSDDMEALVRLGERVRARRLELSGMTQQQAARAAGISDTTWGNIEKGEKVADRSYAKAMLALGWAPISAQRIIAGLEPVPANGLLVTVEGDVMVVDTEDKEAMAKSARRVVDLLLERYTIEEVEAILEQGRAQVRAIEQQRASKEREAAAAAAATAKRAAKAARRLPRGGARGPRSGQGRSTRDEP